MGVKNDKVTNRSFVKLLGGKWQCQCSQGIWGLSQKYLLRVKNLSPKYLLQIKTSGARFRAPEKAVRISGLQCGVHKIWPKLFKGAPLKWKIQNFDPLTQFFLLIQIFLFFLKAPFIIFVNRHSGKEEIVAKFPHY